MDRERFPEQRLTPATVRLLAEHFDRFRDQYKLFVEFHGLDNESISSFFARRNPSTTFPTASYAPTRSGCFKRVSDLWQILARQGEIPDRLLNNSFQRIIQPYFRIDYSIELFDAAQIALNELLRATPGFPNLSQSELITLLAGPNPGNTEMSRSARNSRLACTRSWRPTAGFPGHDSGAGKRSE